MMTSRNPVYQLEISIRSSIRGEKMERQGEMLLYLDVMAHVKALLRWCTVC